MVVKTVNGKEKKVRETASMRSVLETDKIIAEDVIVIIVIIVKLFEPRESHVPGQYFLDSVASDAGTGTWLW